MEVGNGKGLWNGSGNRGRGKRKKKERWEEGKKKRIGENLADWWEGHLKTCIMLMRVKLC